MEKVVYNLVFNRKKKLNGEGKALIQIEAYRSSRKVYFSTKVYIKPTQWDSIRHVIKNHSAADELNGFIKAFILELELREAELLKRGRPFTLKELKVAQTEKEPISFTDFFQNEIAKSDLKLSTQKNHFSTWTALCRFKEKVYFSDLNYNFLLDFEYSMLKWKYHRNTIAKHMKHLKRYVNQAINMDLMTLDKYPFRKYKIKYIDTQRNHLTPNELRRLEALNFDDKPQLQLTLDMFLFSCYTGLRFSDVVKMTKANFILNNKQLWLVYASTKTNISVRIPLNLLFEGRAISIYHRYEKAAGTLFNVPYTSNSNVNKRLKRICESANINHTVTFHTARHTNATLLLYNGVSITTVQKLLGHKSVRTTEIYSDIMDITLIRDLEKSALL